MGADHRLRAGLALVALAVLGLSGCATAPPQRPEDACAIFAEKPKWYKAARKAEARWGTPVQVQLAIIRAESGFRHDAKPPRERFLGVPLWRASNAAGYPQAKDETWDWYREKTGNRGASRGDFADAVDFVGWYTDVSQRTLGISKWDAYSQYLAYHEGHGGYKRGSYKTKPWLMGVARKVESYARTYGAQLATCRNEL